MAKINQINKKPGSKPKRIQQQKKNDKKSSAPSTPVKPKKVVFSFAAGKKKSRKVIAKIPSAEVVAEEIKIEEQSTGATVESGAVRKKRRSRAGTKALREIRKLQKIVDPKLIPDAQFKRVVHEICNQIVDEAYRSKVRGSDNVLRWEKGAFKALQEATQHAISEVFFDSVRYMAHAKRTTVSVDDFNLAKQNVLGQSIGRQWTADTIAEANKENTQEA